MLSNPSRLGLLLVLVYVVAVALLHLYVWIEAPRQSEFFRFTLLLPVLHWLAILNLPLTLFRLLFGEFEFRVPMNFLIWVFHVLNVLILYLAGCLFDRRRRRTRSS